ncbi:50S ribosomal protein L3 [Mycoplasma sp. 2045]|nr:50S ribosomal protein L3 [Mycoplasma sp. 2045]UUM20491.1 50S ribosomal protein L3 [Mycoplasma sp. 2045]
MKGILGRKVGMTQIFTESGKSVPVTVIEVQPNVVSKVLTNDKDGYVATQLATADKKASRANKPEIGHFAKASTTPKRFVKEVRDMSGYELGDLIKADIFKAGELVDVTGTSKGKGFAGTIKRHNQHIGPKSHGGGGGSQPIRQTGSLGDISGNRVYKGMTMPGHLGHVKTTVQNLEVVKVDVENNLLLIKGSIPGPKKSFVVVKEAVKGLPSREEIKLVNVKEAMLMNELIEKAKKFNIEVTVGMNAQQLQELIDAAEANKGE